MQLAKVRLRDGSQGVGLVEGERVRLLDLSRASGVSSLADLLHQDDPAHLIPSLVGPIAVLAQEVTFLAPVDQQEVWAAGVTYKRSQEARERESAGAARFYDLVYTAPRPELFFKATARRVVGPGDAVYFRSDSRWSVPEPELTLVISPRKQLIGFTIGNDMSARDIEGENPLYLPQAKVYDHSCALGPVITLAAHLPPPQECAIGLTIERGGKKAFEGSTSVERMARSFSELIDWLFRDNRFPDGVFLLTGTGLVPPDEFTLAEGDTVTIEIAGIGKLVNRVQRGRG